jgi:hypothetical protein
LCDVFASYLIGSSYGWQHIRLCAGVPMAYDPFESSPTHPADDARFFAVEHALDLLGETASASNLRNQWNSFVGLTGASPPPRYDEVYPHLLLRQLVEEVFAALRGQKVLDYVKLMTTAGSATNILASAWNKHQQDDPKYGTWQAVTFQAAWAATLGTPSFLDTQLRLAHGRLTRLIRQRP